VATTDPLTPLKMRTYFYHTNYTFKNSVNGFKNKPTVKCDTLFKSVILQKPSKQWLLCTMYVNILS